MKPFRVTPTRFDQAFILDLTPRWGGQDATDYMFKVLRHPRAKTQAFRDGQGSLWAWGAVEMWAGVADVWCVFDMRAGSYAREILQCAQEAVEYADGFFGRLQGQIPVEAPTLRLAERFGFVVEGLMHNYGKNARGDYLMVARYGND